jgi:hypothetical protein
MLVNGHKKDKTWLQSAICLKDFVKKINRGRHKHIYIWYNDDIDISYDISIYDIYILWVSILILILMYTDTLMYTDIHIYNQYWLIYIIYIYRAHIFDTCVTPCFFLVRHGQALSVCKQDGSIKFPAPAIAAKRSHVVSGTKKTTKTYQKNKELSNVKIHYYHLKVIFLQLISTFDNF